MQHEVNTKLRVRSAHLPCTDVYCHNPCTDCPAHLCLGPENHARSGAADVALLVLPAWDRWSGQR